MRPATVYPWLTYGDAHADNGSAAHAEPRFGNGLVMVGQPLEGS